MGKIVQKQGMGGLYGGLLPIMCKQVRVLETLLAIVLRLRVMLLMAT
jgi:hypothetical protein